MLISNLLLIPGTGPSASELYQALRYEKTVRLYAGNTSNTEGEYKASPHRMIPFHPLPSFSAPDFLDLLKKAATQANIDYIVPTTDEARRYFEQHSNLFSILDSKSAAVLPSMQGETTVIVDGCSDHNHAPIYVGGRHQVQNTDKETTLWETISLSAAQTSLVQALSNKHELTGAWSIHLDGNNQPLAITPYFTPEMGIYRAIGVNFLLLMLHSKRGNPVSALAAPAQAKLLSEKQVICAELEYETVFLDLDDTLIIHGGINDSIIAFIYHCQANNVPIHLITRHFQNPAITLCEYGIVEDLFESIIWIEDDTPKSAFMREVKSPIFIDDAFSERKEVWASTNIPCLPPESVEALMVQL